MLQDLSASLSLGRSRRDRQLEGRRPKQDLICLKAEGPSREVGAPVGDQAGLGRLVFGASVLEYERPFLS